MFVNSDFSDLLRLFNDNDVRYLVIGGYAYAQYAEPKYTKDLEIWIATGIQNGSLVFQSPIAFGAPLSDMTEDDFAHDGFFLPDGFSACAD